MGRLTRRIFKNNPDISGVITRIHEIRNKSDILNCVYQPTGYDWLGVNIAGKYMFPDNTIEIPQYYSSQVMSDDQISEICKTIADLDFRVFVVQGFLYYISKIIRRLKAYHSDIKILSIYHGFISELSGNTNILQSVNEFISLYHEGSLDRIAVVKDGHEIVFSKLFGVEPFLLYNKVPIHENNIREEGANSLVHIGVLVNNSFRKNLHNQVVAALMIPGTVVHVIDKQEFYYLNNDERIVEHGIMPHASFLRLLTAMDINLHITFSESFGGQVFTESLGAGIPCLTGYSNGFLNQDKDLKTLLSVAEADDPMSIYNRIVQILPLRRSIGERLIEYCRKMNEIADISLHQFINT